MGRELDELVERARPERRAGGALRSRGAAVAFGGLSAAIVWQIFVAIGCGGSEAATVDSGIDGSVSSCAQLNDAAPCLANYECDFYLDAGPNADAGKLDTNNRCTLVGLDSDMDPVICCAAGPRGTGGAGVPCTGPDDCSSGLCAYVDFDVAYCSIACDAGAQCPEVLPACVGVGDAGNVAPFFCGTP